MKKKYSTVTQLHEKQNTELIAYFEEVIPSYSYIARKVWHVVNHGGIKDITRFNTYLQQAYSITKRTANSIIRLIKGRHNAIRELKKTELQNQKRKLEKVKKKLAKSQKKLNSLKKKAGKNQLTAEELQNYRNLKRKVVALKMKKDKITKNINGLQHAIKTGRFKICFGTKNMAGKEPKEAFLLNRDRLLYFLGSKDECAGNQMFQLSYNKQNNQFIIQVRKDFAYKNAKKNEKYVQGKCYFNHHKEKLIKILEEGGYPLTYQIIRRNGKYYLVCTFEIRVEEESILTRKNDGTIGVDFNKGFLALTETNAYGHLVRIWRYDYRYGQGRKTQSDMERIINEIVKEAKKTGKDIIIEDLSFMKKKAELTKAKKKSKEAEYNAMLSSLAYRKYITLMENIAFRNAVNVDKVNPYNTSRIAKQQFCSRMKLNIHTGASYVIARRGQGFQDVLKEKMK